MRTKFGNAYTNENRETNTAFRRHLYHWVNQKTQQNKIFFTNDARFPFTYSYMLRDRVLFCLKRVETEARFFFAYAVRIASIILRTARFLCVLYADIRANATAISPKWTPLGTKLLSALEWCPLQECPILMTCIDSLRLVRVLRLA